MDAASSSQTRELLLLVADRRRWAILELLAGDGLTVSGLVARLEIAQPAVSHHLARLRRAGLVEAVPDGRSRRYVWTRPASGSPRGELQQLLRRWLHERPCAAGLADRRRRPAALEVHLL